jgi:NADH-quinone oxidoreductase subunit I
MKQYFKDIFISVWTILVGMRITFKHMFVPAVTIQYPTVKPALPERARNRLYVNMDDCIGCLQCALACPVNCIDIETVKAIPTDDLGTTSTGQKKRLYVTKFNIDIGKCCYCGLCVPPCSTDCIKMAETYEFSEYNRQDLIYNFSTMTADDVAAAKAKAAAAAAAKSVSQPAPKTETKTENNH